MTCLVFTHKLSFGIGVVHPGFLRKQNAGLNRFAQADFVGNNRTFGNP